MFWQGKTPAMEKCNSSLAKELLARKNQKFPFSGHPGEKLLQFFPRWALSRLAQNVQILAKMNQVLAKMCKFLAMSRKKSF